MAGKSKSSQWNRVKDVIASWGRPQLLELIKGLFDISADARMFITSKAVAGPDEATLESLRKEIRGALYTSRGNPHEVPRFADASAVVRRYKKAAGDPAGVLELSLCLAETFIRFTCEFGDIDDPFYSRITTAIKDCEKVFRSAAGAALYPAARERLVVMRTKARGFGWGTDDEFDELITSMDELHGPAA